MIDKVGFITTERDHLTALSRLLAEALEPSFLSDPRHPLLVAVDGTFESGKKIVSDMVRHALLTGYVSFTGKLNFDEYWHGKGKNGQPLEIDFLNNGWGDDYQTLPPTTEKNSWREFLTKRRRGGISFIQNSRDFVETTAGLKIWIYKDRWPQVGTPAQRESYESLCRTFNIPAQEKGSWVRYVEIDVKDERLLQSPRFQALMDKLKDGHPFPAAPASGLRRHFRDAVAFAAFIKTKFCLCLPGVGKISPSESPSGP